MWNEITCALAWSRAALVAQSGCTISRSGGLWRSLRMSQNHRETSRSAAASRQVLVYAMSDFSSPANDVSLLFRRAYRIVSICTTMIRDICYISLPRMLGSADKDVYPKQAAWRGLNSGDIRGCSPTYWNGRNCQFEFAKLRLSRQRKRWLVLREMEREVSSA